LKATDYPGSGRERIRRIDEEDFIAFTEMHTKRDVVDVGKVNPIRAFKRSQRKVG
jgi:hypothetical protein